MADQPYYSVFTKKGLELLTEAIRHGTKLGITDMAFGDGGGVLPVPNESFTKLVNEVHRTQLNSLAPDPNNANWLRAEAIISSATGGFNIRELGLYAGDVLVAYSNYPATYKPNPSDGTARIMTFRMVLQIDNTASFELKIDADIVMATIASVDAAKQEVYENTVTTVDTADDLSTLDGNLIKTANVKNVGTFSYSKTAKKWIQHLRKTSIGFDIDTWLQTTVITPDLFLDQAENDDLKAFYLACDKANSLNLPVTLLPRTYELNDTIDLRKANNGIATSSERFSATTLKATANPGNASTFVNYQNMDRTKLCSFRVDANSLYDIGIDTSYTIQVGPSLNITFDAIWVKGYNKIGWLAENNSDVYFKSCAIFEPGSKSDSSIVSIKCITIGGPAQFECCNFLGGKQQVSAQHITNIMCVLRGVEFLTGSWNNYSAVGSHHFASIDTNSCFTIIGELWGFDVAGGLCEASNNGYLFNGNGGNTITGKLEFNGTKVTPNEGNMYLDKGTLGIRYGKLIASFNGGMQNLTGLDILKIFDDVSFNSTNNTVSAVSKDVVMSASAYRNYRTERSNMFSRTYAQRNDSSLVNVSPIYGTLSSTGGYYGIIDILSNKVASGDLYIISDDKMKSAQYRVTNLLDKNGNVVWNLVEISNVSTTENKFSLYYADNNLQVILNRDDASDKTTKNVDFSFIGFITNT